MSETPTRVVLVETIEEAAPPRARRLIPMNRVLDITDKSRSTLWRNIREGVFPAPVQIGGNRIAWFEDEIVEWQESLPRMHGPISTPRPVPPRSG